MSADAATIAFYDVEAPLYAGRTAPKARAPWLDAFTAMLPPGGRVLDLGSGGGWATGRLRQCGFDALAQDVSAGMLAEVARRHGAPTRRGGFGNLKDVAAFDGIWASFSLLHAPKAKTPAHVGRMFRALRPGGALYLGLKEGDGEARDALGRFYAYWRAPEMGALLQAQGFAVLKTRLRGGGVGYDGAPSVALHILARRPVDARAEPG